MAGFGPSTSTATGPIVPGTSSLGGAPKAKPKPTTAPAPAAPDLSGLMNGLAAAAAASQNKPVMAAPAPVANTTVAPHPFQTDVFKAQMQNVQDLGKNTDEMATLAMQRQRDVNSGQMKEAQALRGSQGFGGGGGITERAMAQKLGQGMTGMNADLANAGRVQVQQGLANAGQSAGSIAGIQSGMFNNLGNYQTNLMNAQTNAAQAAQQQQNQMLNFYLSLFGKMF